MAAMDIPIFREKYYAKIQDHIMFNELEATAVEVMERAAAKEREAAIEEGNLINSVPVIDFLQTNHGANAHMATYIKRYLV